MCLQRRFSAVFSGASWSFGVMVMGWCPHCLTDAHIAKLN
jgi:hypothetical protein